MYTITANGQLLHNPYMELSGNVCVNPVLTERLNTHGSLTFSVAPSHPLYNSLKKRLTYVKVYDDGEEIWRGRILSIARTWNNTKSVTCEGEMSYLIDTTVRPFHFKGTVEAFLTWLLNKHLYQLAPNDERSISIGTVTVNEEVDISSSKPQTVWECINSNLLQKFDGYMYTRKTDLGTIVLDYVEDFTEDAEQEITFGKNIVSLDEDINAGDVITKMIPYGAKSNVAPTLYKQRSSGSTYYDKCEDKNLSAGNYLIVASGAALQNAAPVNNRMPAKLVTITEANDTFTIQNPDADIIWEIPVSGEDNSVTIGNGGYWLAATGIGGQATRTATNAGRWWKISNGDKGATITSSTNAGRDVPAVLHGDPDEGFGCEESASGDSREPAEKGEYNGDRITVKRCATIANGVHELGSDVVRSPDALALWENASIVGYEIFEEADSPDKLMTLARESLAKRFAANISLTVRVADLSLIGEARKRLKIGTYGRIVSGLHDLNLRMLGTEKTTPFSNPEQTSMTFGAGRKTLSDLQGGLIADVS